MLPTISDLSSWLSIGQFIFGVLAALIGSALWRKLPHRMIWRFTKEDDIVICLATSHLVDTGDYIRPTTGVGQVKALAATMPSIMTGYGDRRKVTVYFSEDMPAPALSQNIVVIGGAKNNVVARRFLERLSAKSGLSLDADRNTMILDGHRYRSASTDGAVNKDWAIIMHAPNPFAEGRNWVTVLAGSSTYGVAAAAKYHVDRRGVLKNLRHKAYVRICDVEVMRGEIASISHCVTKVFAR